MPCIDMSVRGQILELENCGSQTYYEIVDVSLPSAGTILVP